MKGCNINYIHIISCVFILFKALVLVPLENLFMDYMRIMQLMNQGADFNELICRGRYKRGSNSTNADDSGMSGLQGAMANLFNPRNQQQRNQNNNTRRRGYSGYDNCSMKILAYPEYMKRLANKTAMKLSSKGIVQFKYSITRL